MKRRSLGQTGIELSEIAFGTVSLGVPYGIGVTGAQDMPSELEAVGLLRAAVDKGINFFDTARGYGCSEERLGKAFGNRAFGNRAFGNRRSEVIICTKCAHLHDERGELPTGRDLNAAMDRSLNDSLSALRTDYVDVYMLHDAGLDVMDNPVVQTVLASYRKAGKARALGISTYTVEETRAAIESGVWDVIQLAYNLMDQRQHGCFNLAAERGVGIVVRSVLFKGILTDRGRNLHPELKSVEQHRARYGELLCAQAPTLSELAIRFVLSQIEVSSILVGIDKPEYLDKALTVADGNYFDEATFEKARALAYPDPDFLDLKKWDRMGWLT